MQVHSKDPNLYNKIVACGNDQPNYWLHDQSKLYIKIINDKEAIGAADLQCKFLC